MNKKVLLLILDGWGITQDPKVSAIYNAKTPFINSLYKIYPSAQLRTDGAHVGLPEGQMGNSEVGHMNLGAGRIVYQNLAKINKAIATGTFAKEATLLNAFAHAKKHQKNIHLIGLVSNGGIHSHNSHLKGLLDMAQQQDVKNVFVHAFTDGRDCDPKSGKFFIEDLEEHLEKTTGTLASVTGRYYAMDRDHRWERIQKAYDALVHGKGIHATNASKSISESYAQNITDEFIEPIILVDDKNQPKALIKKNDVVIFFNFRTDRGRQLTQVLHQEDFTGFGMQKIPLYFVTLTNYNEKFKDIHVVYKSKNIENSLGEVLEKAGKTQIRIAETEKYPHVTFFFSGGRETPFEGEKRLLCPSPKVATYDLQPAMSAYEIQDAIVPALEKENVNFVCLNFANGDMVGHTGVFEAAIKACETVDICTKKVVETALKHQYTTLLIADHGNCETMMNPDGTPHTAHTTNPVPFVVIDPDIQQLKDGVLGDIAPTILHLMGIAQPKEMTQHSLLK